MPLTIPLRFNTRGERGEQGLRPFSQEWLAAPPELRAPPPRRMPELPAWMPSERILAAIMVMLLVLTTVITSGGGVPKTTASIAGPNAVAGIVDGGAQTPESAAAADETPDAAETEPSGAPATTDTASNPATTPDEAPAVGGTSEPGALLPRYRIVSYYGHPHTPEMGILGEYGPQDLLDQLMDEVAEWEAADPSRPVMPAFEVIASVAQNWETDDGTYLLYTDSETIQQYVDFTRENGILLILDLQIGRDTVINEIDRVREWLAEPHVQLALDPEFAMAEGQIPGEAIGSIDAKDVAVAQRELAEIVEEYDLPPKLLIVHKFEEDMITNVAKIKVVPGVQTVINFDGLGAPENKIEGYTLFLEEEPAEFAGIKLFYKEDDPLMMPADVLAFDRPPDVVIYD